MWETETRKTERHDDKRETAPLAPSNCPSAPARRTRAQQPSCARPHRSCVGGRRQPCVGGRRQRHDARASRASTVRRRRTTDSPCAPRAGLALAEQPSCSRYMPCVGGRRQPCVDAPFHPRCLPKNLRGGRGIPPVGRWGCEARRNPLRGEVAAARTFWSCGTEKCPFKFAADGVCGGS